jgi:hypothetical protein
MGAVKTKDSAANEFNQLSYTDPCPPELENSTMVLSRASAPILGVFRLGPTKWFQDKESSPWRQNRYADKRYFAKEKPVFSSRSLNPISDLGALEPLVTTKSALEKAVLTSPLETAVQGFRVFRVIFALFGTPINVIFAARSDADKRYFRLSLRRHLFFWTPGKVIFTAGSSLRR